MTEEGCSKFQRIVRSLQEIYAMEDGKYADYELYVTGHSLGGALCQLLSLAIAGSKEAKAFVPEPVTGISFASPPAGVNTYNEAFQVRKE